MKKNLFILFFCLLEKIPDSIIKKEGKYKFENRINNSKSIFDFLFYLISLKVDISTYEGKINFVKLILPFISKIKSSVIKIILYNKLINKVGNLNFNLFNKFIFISKKKKKKKKNILRYLISFLLKKPNLSFFVNFNDYLFKLYNIYILRLFLNIVYICIYNKNIFGIEIINFFENNRIKNYLTLLLSWDNNIFKLNKKIVFVDFLKKLKLFIINENLKKMILKEKLYGLNKKEKKKIWFFLKLKNLFF